MKRLTVSFVFLSVLALLFANMSGAAVGDDDSEYKMMGPAPVFAGFEHSDLEDGFWHGPGKEMPFTNGCVGCHGADLRGFIGPSCYSCHGMEWDEKGPPPVYAGQPHPDEEDGVYHGAGKEMPFDSGCTTCHGDDLRGFIGPSCYSCHGPEWEDDDYSRDDGYGSWGDHRSDDDSS